MGPLCPRWPGRRSAAGISWVVLNRNVDYIAEIRKTHRIPIFGVSSDHEEIGRIQGHQFAALLPKGGTVLHIQGPSESLAAKQRTTGMYETKPADVQVKVLRAQWTEASSYRAVSSWLRLSTSHQNRIDLIAAQDDGMALGARKAFQELPDNAARQRWLSLPFIGCDGLPKTGQAWVKRGLLTATIFAGPNTGQALEMLVKALQTGTHASGEHSDHTAFHSHPGCAGGIAGREGASAVGVGAPLLLAPGFWLLVSRPCEFSPHHCPSLAKLVVISSWIRF